MAIIKLKDAQVARLDSKGFGVQVFESNTFNGETRKTYWKVWFKEPHGLTEGDVVSLSGFHGDRIGEPYVDKDGVTQPGTIQRSINSPRIEEASAGSTPYRPAAQSAGFLPADDDTPF
jgi:hypothetical protein